MQKYYSLVEKYKELILKAERYLWENPEPGYKEFKTNAYMLEQFEKLGYKNIVKAENITGFYTVIDTKREGPTVLVMAELDSLINRSHPECDKETGAVHTCGHHIQCAAMLGLAAALKEEGALDELCGKIKLCVVPAEEGIELGYRNELIKKGIIKYTSGKTEFISRRYFDDVDISFMIHACNISKDAKAEGLSDYENKKIYLSIGHTGVIRKQVIVRGKSAHAGAHPHKGINALNAVNLMLLACNSLRETFQESDLVRFHSIITKGGDAVNAVPDEVVIESYVRAATPNALKRENKKINRALCACGAAMGAQVKIIDRAGSQPVNGDANFNTLASQVLDNLVGKEGYFIQKNRRASSSDFGDVSTLVPAIISYVGGCTGTFHGNDLKVIDPYECCVFGAQYQFAILVELLKNGAEKAKDIISKYTPIFKSVDEYISFVNSLNIEKDAVTYKEDGTVLLDY